MFDALNETFTKVNPEYRGSAGFTTIDGLVWMIANVLIGAGISVGVIGMAYGFVQFATSLGDPKKIVDAKYGVLLGGVAMLVSLLGFAIKGALFKTVGL